MQDLHIFSDNTQDNYLIKYPCWTDADNLNDGDEVTIVNSNCEFSFDNITGTFEPNLYYCYICDLEVLDVDLSEYVPEKSNNGGAYAYANCRVLKVHEKTY